MVRSRFSPYAKVFQFLTLAFALTACAKKQAEQFAPYPLLPTVPVALAPKVSLILARHSQRNAALDSPDPTLQQALSSNK